MQINQEESGLIVRFQPNQNVAGVQIVVQDSGLVNLSDKDTQLSSQPLTHKDLPGIRKGRKGLLNKRAERLRILKTPGDEETVSRSPAVDTLAQAEGRRGWNSTICHGASTFELHRRFRWPNQLPEPRAKIAHAVMFEIEAQLREMNSVNRPVRTMLDGNGLARL